MKRTAFIKYIGLGSILLMHKDFLLGQNTTNKFLDKMNEKPNYFEDELMDKGLIIRSGEGESLNLNGITVTFKLTSEASNNQLGIYEISLLPKTIGAKLHYHRFMDETFIVNKGIPTFEIGDRTYNASPGTVAYIPRFTPHGFRNDSDETVTLMLIFNPSEKREGFFKGLYETLNEEPVNPEKFLKLYNKYDSFPVDTSNMIPTEE